MVVNGGSYWLLMVNYIWLVVSTNPSEKWWSSWVGSMKFPTEWKVIKFMFQTTNQIILYNIWPMICICAMVRLTMVANGYPSWMGFPTYIYIHTHTHMYLYTYIYKQIKEGTYDHPQLLICPTFELGRDGWSRCQKISGIMEFKQKTMGVKQ